MTGGAVLQTFQTVNIGNQSASVGTVSITANSTWNATGGRINIGVDGSGTVELQNGAELKNANNISVAATDGLGALNVTTASATMNSLNLGGGNGFGLTSNSSLSIMAGGSVQTNTLAIGGNTGIIVDGKAPASNTVSTLSVGSLSFAANLLNGGIIVSNGGQFTVTSGNIATPGGRRYSQRHGSKLHLQRSEQHLHSQLISPARRLCGRCGRRYAQHRGHGFGPERRGHHRRLRRHRRSRTWNITPNAGAISGSILSVQSSSGSLQINAGGTVNVSGEAMFSWQQHAVPHADWCFRQSRWIQRQPD